MYVHLCLCGLVSCVLQCLQLGNNHVSGSCVHVCMYESLCELVICVEYPDVYVFESCMHVSLCFYFCSTRTLLSPALLPGTAGLFLSSQFLLSIPLRVCPLSSKSTEGRHSLQEPLGWAASDQAAVCLGCQPADPQSCPVSRACHSLRNSRSTVMGRQSPVSSRKPEVISLLAEEMSQIPSRRKLSSKLHLSLMVMVGHP